MPVYPTGAPVKSAPPCWFVWRDAKSTPWGKLRLAAPPCWRLQERLFF
jgi:hypothetical protein